MKTPKEEAIQLVLQFYEVVKNKYPSTLGIPLAKQCALIAVQFAMSNPLNTDGYNLHLESVKTEINNL